MYPYLEFVNFTKNWIYLFARPLSLSAPDWLLSRSGDGGGYLPTYLTHCVISTLTF